MLKSLELWSDLRRSARCGCVASQCQWCHFCSPRCFQGVEEVRGSSWLIFGCEECHTFGPQKKFFQSADQQQFLGSDWFRNGQQLAHLAIAGNHRLDWQRRLVGDRRRWRCAPNVGRPKFCGAVLHMERNVVPRKMYRNDVKMRAYQNRTNKNSTVVNCSIVLLIFDKYTRDGWRNDRKKSALVIKADGSSAETGGGDPVRGAK